MKIYFSNYRNHWLSPYTILEKVFFWREIDYDEPIIEKLASTLDPFCKGLQNVRQFFNRKINYVKIDRWDTWSMDHTLSYIILPMLKQLRDTKHGSPIVDEEDVPKFLQTEAFKNSKKKKPKYAGSDVHALDMGDSDNTLHDRWDWVINEMIWSFEQKVKDDDELEFFNFAKDGKAPWDKDYVRPDVDWDGLRAHQARKQKGFELFGKYFQNLWD